MLSARCHIRHIGSPGKDARCAHLSATLRPGIGISPTNVGNATVLADGTPAKPIQGAETMQRARHSRFLFLGERPRSCDLIREPISRWVRSPFVDDDPVIDTTGDPLAGLHRQRRVDGHPHGQVRAASTTEPSLTTRLIRPHSQSSDAVSGSPVHPRRRRSARV